MTSCRLIICEKESHFGSAVRRELPGGRWLVVEVRSLAACEAALAESPESLVAIEATAKNIERVVQFLAALRRRHPRAAAAVLLASDAADAEALLAEAGAIVFFRSVLESPSLARLAQRKLASASTSDLSPHQFVAERLPWAAYASR